MVNRSALQGLQDLLFFPLKDSNARKRLLVAGLLGFASFIVPIIPSIFLIGYAGLIMRSIIHDKAEPAMPEWKDWSEMFTLGLKLFGASFIYLLPAIIVMIFGYAAMMAPAFIEAFSHPQGYSGASPFIGISIMSMFGGMAVFGIGLLIIIPLSLVMPPMLSHVAATDSFSAAFHFRDWWRVLQSNIGGFFVALILSLGLAYLMIFAAQILYMTIVLCIVVPFLLAFITGYLTVVIYSLYAEAYLDGIEKLPAQTTTA